MTMATRGPTFSAVRSVGTLLPPDMLLRIAEGKDVKGSEPADYHVIGRRSVRDEAERHWEYLRSVWNELRERLPSARESELPTDPTGRAHRQWLTPLFEELGFGHLVPVGAVGIVAGDGTKSFPVSHRWSHVPIHMAAWNANLEKPTGGMRGVPPQSLVQECLNRSSTHLWAVISNGRQLRLLRDSNALATASYVEFDLEAIFDGALFAEFVLLYRLLHVSRFETAEDMPPSTCWLEQWRIAAIESGMRALDHQRDGVQQAITVLGSGFLQHPANSKLRGDLDVHAFHVALLRLVYRLIFLFVAEDRGILHPRGVTDLTRRRYTDFFSTQRLRSHALRRPGTAHSDLYQALTIVLDALGDEAGRPELGLPGLGLGGLFDAADADAPLGGALIANVHLLEGVRHLARVRDHGSSRWRRVDYRNLGTEELGSIYESLLELVPKHNASDRTFELVNRAGNERKRTGGYYTPGSLIETLLDSTLDPVIDDAQKRGETRAARAVAVGTAGAADPAAVIVEELLNLTVCDAACGTGHFLVAAARRIAKRVAAVREGNPEPGPDSVRHALREVIARCVYGVELNPMAVELTKFSLWLEAMEPGRPLVFLTSHVKLGNSLVGATPRLLRSGIPGKAFSAVEGDDPKWARFLAKQNDSERRGQSPLPDMDLTVKVANSVLAGGVRRVAAGPSSKLQEIHRLEAAYRELRERPEYAHARRVADAWCAAFMWPKTKDAPSPITHDAFTALQEPGESAAWAKWGGEIVRLREQYRFFHWHLEFPEIFTVPEDGGGDGVDVDPGTGWAGGFSCVVGNPPWDKVDFEDKKYFSVVEPALAAVAGTARRKAIAVWEEKYPETGAQYREARRKVKSTFLFVSGSGVFPLCARGLTVRGVNSLQTDQLFAERLASIVSPGGRFGCVIPTAIATGAGAQYLFKSFAERGGITSLFDFENRRPLFLDVDSRIKFCLLAMTGRDLREPEARFSFYLTDPVQLDIASRVFSLAPEEIRLINPNTGTLPIFRSRRDADLTVEVYRRVPALWVEEREEGNPWGIRFKNLFNMTDDSDVFCARQELLDQGWDLHGNVFIRDGKRMLPLYEGKMAHHFDHRWNSYYGTGSDDRQRLGSAELRDPNGVASPRYWIAEDGLIPTIRKAKEVEVPGVAQRLKELGWESDWLCGWRDVTNSTNERTAIPAFLPRAAVGHKFPLMLPKVCPPLVAALIATQSSLVFDYISRQKIGSTSMGLFVWKQLPVPVPTTLDPHTPFLTPRVLELVHTAHDMTPLARDLGDTGAPFRWDDDRRARIRAELDAYFFHLYGIDREDTDYILETFQSATGGLKHNEIAKYGTYRTKDFVLAEYDRMAVAGPDLAHPLTDGQNYTSALTPPPGHGSRHRPRLPLGDGASIAGSATRPSSRCS